MAKTRSGDVVLKDDQKVIIGKQELTRRLLEFLVSLRYKNGQLYYGDDLVIDLNSISTDITPDRTFARSLGTENKQWKEVRVGPGPIYLNNIPIIVNRISEILIQSTQNQNLTLQSQGTSAVILRSNEVVQVDSNLDVTGDVKIQNKDVALIQDNGKLSPDILPDIATISGPNVYQVDTVFQMTSIPDVKSGDTCIVNQNKSYVYNGSSWELLSDDSMSFSDGDIIFGGNASI